MHIVSSYISAKSSDFSSIDEVRQGKAGLFVEHNLYTVQSALQIHNITGRQIGSFHKS